MGTRAELVKPREKIARKLTLAATATAMKAKVKIFDRLRAALRIAEPGGNKGLNDDGDNIDIKTIKEKVEAFRAFLVEGKRRRRHTAGQKS